MDKPVRDPVTGQFAYSGDLERLCKCGHQLGFHLHGGHDCLETPCSCQRFRPSHAHLLTPESDNGTA